MICFVDVEHENALQNGGKRAIHQAYCRDVKDRLEEISGCVCFVQNYRQATQHGLERLGINALILSGNTTEWSDYDRQDLARLFDIIRQARSPILGICGGLQLIAMAHGAPIGPMRTLKQDEQALSDHFAQGYFKEWGFGPVHKIKADPLFDGLEGNPVFLHAHYWEVKQTPPGFEVLGSTDACRIQVLKQIDKPVYGVQFHPEGYQAGETGYPAWLIDWVYPGGYSEEQPDGRRLLANFLRVAGVYS